MLDYSQAIFDLDPRIKRKLDQLDLGQIRAQKQLLLELRELLKIPR